MSPAAIARVVIPLTFGALVIVALDGVTTDLIAVATASSRYAAAAD